MSKETASGDGILVLSPVVQKYVFSKSLQGDYAREVCKEVKARVARDFKNASAFKQPFEFDEQDGLIKGSNLFYGIVVNEELSKEGSWIPTIVEAKKLDAAGRLSNGVYRDFGMAVYSANGQNAEIAKILVNEADKRGWKTPILAPFNALKLKKGGKDYGVTVSFTDNTSGVITGDEAREYLQAQFKYTSNNGARRLLRNGVGSWLASWDGLANSRAYGRVDFVCGEATAQNLEGAVLEQFNKVAQTEMQRLNDRIRKAQVAALDALKG